MPIFRHPKQTRTANPDKSETLFADRLIKSGLFDPVWYLSRYRDVAEAKMDAFEHFTKHGHSEGREPNGLFDSIWYLERNSDVAESGMSALQHYSAYGAYEGRPPHPLFDPKWYEDTQRPNLRSHGFTPLQHYLNYGRYEGALTRSIVDEHYSSKSLGLVEPVFQTPQLQGPSIAVAVHIYYGDLADEICSYLKNIPYRFTALFSVPDESVAAQVRTAVERYDLDCSVEFHMAQNRGRNFGPFLVAFRERILSHDLFLHIHGKKSLRTGDTQSLWRKSLYEGLLGSSTLVSAVIGKFAQDQQMGMVYPSTHRQFGPWFHSWLGSGHRGAELFRRIGIKKYRSKGSIDLPVGGMFWARTSALRSLLTYNWKYEYFDAEPSHHDGTLAHGIEHGLCDIVRHHSYDYIEYDHYYGVYRRNWNEKLLYKYKESGDFSRWMVDYHDTISFDFYDTLFCRAAVTPDDVHNYIGWALKARNLIDDEADFYPLRKEAEAHARSVGARGDVNLDEIYASFPAISTWPVKAVKAAKALELEVERKCLKPRQDITGLLKQARASGKRTLIVSDSYMPKSFFERVLADHDMFDLVDELIISSDVGMRKDRDDVWAMIHESECNDRKFVHFGDNEESDIHLPTIRGIPSVHVLNTTMLAEIRGVLENDSWRVERTKWRDGVVIGPVMAELCSNAFVDDPSFRPVTINSADRIGYAVFGPIYFGFFTWLINHPRIKSVNRIGFLAREGLFIKENYDYIRSLTVGSKIRLPESGYFHISRRLAIGAAQAEGLDLDFVMRGSAFRGTFAEFLMARAGFELDSGSGLSDAPVSTESVSQKEVLAKMLRTVEEDIVSAGAKKKALLLDYAAQNGFLEPGLSVVDLGYSGTIQKALQTILPNPLTGYYMVTTPEIVDVFDAGSSAHAFYSEVGSRPESAVKNLSMILEALLTADHGSVIDYVREGKKIAPVFKDGGVSQQEFDYLRCLNGGAKRYIKDVITTYGPEVVQTVYDPATCEAMLRALAEGRIVPPTEFWEKLHVEDDFCGNGEISVSRIYGL
ncbi:rhamnan synthesis F family protein [Brevundimonas sp. SL130]|uniref:rhamnan synthesis F family protein n=1 Tax=Brevundimonas sp. SL130 TaxID=2995143 RepID=UPI00226C6867|nr:rhamnan synthesis F family protein [Brevundimonas sp. SL130]WAC59863.1 hypothetical protein OU998_16970 [Brevundimonas sp. SL130]